MTLNDTTTTGSVDAYAGDFYCHFCCTSRPRRGVADVLGAAMCLRCCANQASRRQVAFVLESVISTGVYFAYTYASFATIVFFTGPGDSLALWIWAYVMGFGLLMVMSAMRRDCSFLGAWGKRICGVRAVDRDTLKPIGAQASFRRNVVLFLPFAQLLIGANLVKAGPRCGDGWANSVVLRTRDLEHPVLHGAKTCRGCWDIYDPADPAGCRACGPQVVANAAA